MKSLEQLTDSVFYIMAAFTEPRHGYAVMSLVEKITHGEVNIGPASLYTIIKKLIKQEYVELFDDTTSRRKVYVLTEKGREILRTDIERRKTMVHFAEDGLNKGREYNEEDI
ncbi:PadR family transcriptional regulator [Cytobacillus firmus]|uniref:PadR family transcriptional regulator n=1 Tax=Cytobacillus firmus TaxID=1399 RepID=UPI00218585A3|nr:helix-turn-helix transcriptional regulator [Cytobacillus firmus]URM32647.1 PadR family transcriptional regulator [Cytobacillus firmus]